MCRQPSSEMTVPVPPRLLNACALACVLGCFSVSAQGIVQRADGKLVSGWQLWLESSSHTLPPVTAPNFELARTNRKQDGERLRSRGGPYWTGVALDLIVRQRLNPLRAARVL